MTSCDKKVKVDDKPREEEKVNEIQTLVQDILDLPRLQWIYHPEVHERLPVKILESGLVTKNLKLRKFDKDVLIMTKDELEANKTLDFVNIEELFFKGDTLSFYLTYDVEGAFADGKYVWTGDKWRVLNYTVGEH
jgi:hypothetical protein